MRTHCHGLQYHLIVNKQDVKTYLPLDRHRCGLVLVRRDCWTDTGAQALHQIPPWELPTPATAWHGGVFWNHPFNEHTTVDPETRHDMQGDQVCRTIYLHLAALGLLYRDNLHLGRPRLGQWLIDSFGIAHWIHPRSFAIAMGFPHDFQLPTDDITAYKLLSESACSPTTAIWLHIAQHAIGRGDCSAFYEAFAAMPFKAIPPQFRDLLTGKAVCHPRPTATHVSCEQLAMHRCT